METRRPVGPEFRLEPLQRVTYSRPSVTLRFGPQSEYILADQSVIPIGGEELTRRACLEAGRNLAIGEWREAFGIERPYRKTCDNQLAHSTAVVDLAKRARSTEEYKRATTWAVEGFDPNTSDEVCRSGVVNGAAATVLPACEHAVAWSVQPYFARDHRGIARAAAQDLQGALTDFRGWWRRRRVPRCITAVRFSTRGGSGFASLRAAPIH
jgi:hypothetical protein